MLVLVVAATAGLLLNFDKSSDNDPPPIVQTSEVANTAQRIDFSLTDSDGNLRQLSEWSGMNRVVNFWATWCAPCRREIPLLKRLQDEQRENGLQVIGIAVDFMEEVQNYAVEADFNYPILVGQEDAMAAAESSGVDFIGLPFTLVISRQGELLYAHIGEIVEAQVEGIVEVLARIDRGELDMDGAREALSEL